MNVEFNSNILRLKIKILFLEEIEKKNNIRKNHVICTFQVWNKRVDI